MAAPLSVTATAGGNAQPGILLRVLVLTGAAIPVVPNAAGQSGPSAHTVRLTPEGTGSWIVSSTINLPFSAAPPTAAAGNTVLDAVSDTLSSASQDYAYGTFTSGALNAGTAFTAGSTDFYAGGVAAAEIIKSGTAAIALDGSSPPSVGSVSTGSPVTSVTTDSFLPPPGSLLVALVSAAADQFGTGGMFLSDSSGLQWTQAASAAAEGNGYAGVWWAVAPSSLTVTTTSLPAGTTFLGYGSAVQAAGGFPPYSWSIASGSLPAGLNLFPDGTIRGQAKTAATSTFTAQVTDASGATATSGSLTLTISDVPASGVTLTGSWLAKAGSYSYGTLSVPVANRDHDWLFVAASWEDGEDVALAFVADDAHNVYRPMFYTTTGTIRTQVFMVNNSRPAGTVYISTSAFARWLTVSIHSFGGMAPWPNVDLMVITPDDGPGSSFDMGITTSYADLLFAVGAFAGTPVAIQVSGSGATWHEAGSHSSGNTTAGVSQLTAWAVNTAPGTAVVDFSRMDGAVHTYSGGIIAVRYNVPALVNPNPAWPIITVQAAFGYPVGNPTNLPSWTDISDRFLGLSGQRGRSFELDELTASDLVLTLDNFDGKLTPFYKGGYDLDLITPVRIFADWQGRRYTIAAGIITAIPQSFDFQRGIVKVNVSDDYAKLPQIILPSCMLSELLYDEPLDLWPLNDPQGATFASNWSGRSTATLIPTWGKYGGGITNNTPNTGFGNSTSNNQFAVYPSVLMGTTDNVWGSYTNLASGTLTDGKANHVHGSALAARNHTNLPMKPTGATFEVWASLVNTAINWASGITLFSIGDAKGTSGGGNYLTLAIPAGKESGSTYTAGADVIVVSQGSSSSVATHSFTLPVNPWTKGGWHHYAVTVTTAGVVTVYQDGVAVGSFTGKFPNGTPDYISFGGNPFVSPQTIVGGTAAGISQVSSVAGMWMGYMANGAVFDRAIDAERILAHYQSGSTGFVGETAGLRIQRFLNYAKWSGPQAIEKGVSRQQQLNYLGGGYGSSGLSGAVGQYDTSGGGFSDQGAQVDVSIQDVAAGELGFLFVAADGTLTFRQRSNTYNLPVVTTIGDMDFAINRTDFSDWLANGGDNCTVALSSSWSYAGGKSALLTVTGLPGVTTAQPRVNPEAIYPGDTVGGSGWVMSPQGCFVTMVIDFKDSTGTNISAATSASTWCPPLTPVFISVPPGAVPSNAVAVDFHPLITGTPAAGTELYCDRVRLSPGGYQMPYNDDVGITVDAQYLYNDVVITRNYDSATYRAYDSGSRSKYFPRVFTRTIYTDLADSTAVVDIAQWLIADYRAANIRISQVTIDPSVNPDSWHYALSIDIGDIVVFQRTPVGADPIAGTFQVLSIDYDIEQDKAEFTYVLAPAWGSGVLTVDDPKFGIVGGKLAL